ncbi:ribonuclease P protein component [Minwuia sp.]|uniref:ribonuclease P protein component n=1 Tax=Minwuia sp. TaxID=2493630 RepID=UPI003A8EB19A
MRVGRLKKRADFLRLSRTRLKSASTGLVLQAQPMPEQLAQPDGESRPDMRVGFTASKKVGNAVRRSRAKRRLRAITDSVLKRQAAPDHDYVLIARPATIDRNFSDLEDDLHFSLKRLGLLREGRAS